MDQIEVTSIVIPLDIREQLGLREGEKFIVVGEDDTVLLKKISMPSFKNFDKLIQKTQAFAKEHSITENKLDRAIIRSRK